MIGGNSDSLETSYTIADGLVSGSMYRFRYRSKNINGKSGWSATTYIKAASVPSRPPAPAFNTATATSITLNLYSSLDNKGSDITALELYRNLGGTSTTYQLVATLPAETDSYTLTVATDGITSGVIYRFKVKTENDQGESDFSEEEVGGVSSFPA